jgi:hypothetical protein
MRIEDLADGNGGRVKRVFRLIPTMLSVLVFLAAVGLHFRSQSTADEVYIPATGQTLYHLHSGRGDFQIQRLAQWPAPPRFVHTTHPPNQQITPVFSRQRNGTFRRQWRFNQFYFTYGTTRVVLTPSGLIDFGSPAAPLYQSFTSLPFSQPLAFWTLNLPYWSVILVSAILPTFITARAVRPLLRDSESNPKDPIDHWG